MAGDPLWRGRRDGRGLGHLVHPAFSDRRQRKECCCLAPLWLRFSFLYIMSVVVHASQCACVSQMVTCGGFGDKYPYSTSHLADSPHHYYWWVVVVRGERHTFCVAAREQLSGSQFLPATVTWVLRVEVRLSGICSKCLSLLNCLTNFLCSFLFCLRLKPLV